MEKVLHLFYFTVYIKGLPVLSCKAVLILITGQGSMALSNSWGSSTFDILLCLGIPWLIKSTYFPNQPGVDGHYVRISSHGLEYSTFALLLILILVYSILYFNKFKLDKKVSKVRIIDSLVEGNH